MGDWFDHALGRSKRGGGVLWHKGKEGFFGKGVVIVGGVGVFCGGLGGDDVTIF